MKTHSKNPETENMGAIVVAHASDRKVKIGHVGDSRAYLYRKESSRSSPAITYGFSGWWTPA